MGFYISTSVIQGAGKGLFTKQEFKKGDFIMDVTGSRLTPTEVEASYSNSNYLLEMNDGSGDCIEVEGYARYANDAEGLTRIPGLKNNAEFCSDEEHNMFVRATRNIKVDSEVLISYGENYWDELRREVTTSGS